MFWLSTAFFGLLGFLLFIAAIQTFRELPSALFPQGFSRREYVWLLEAVIFLATLVAWTGVMFAVHPLIRGGIGQ